MFDGKQIGAPQTCAANDADKCGDSDEWEGEFFPGIPKIKYEVDLFIRIYLCMSHKDCNGILSVLNRRES